VIILIKSDRQEVAGGQEQHNCLFGRLTLNGLVALLATLIQSSMLMAVSAAVSQSESARFSVRSSHHRAHKLSEFDSIDSASRGPMGSMKLLLSGTRPQLASIGAAITALSLAFGTFSQQVVGIQSSGSSGRPATTRNLPEYLRQRVTPSSRNWLITMSSSHHTLSLQLSTVRFSTRLALSLR